MRREVGYLDRVLTADIIDQAGRRLAEAPAAPAQVFVGWHARGEAHEGSDRRAHDLGYLLEAVVDGNVNVPEHVGAAEWLTPWAAGFCYDEPEIAGFYRPGSLRTAERAIEWAQGVYAAAG